MAEEKTYLELSEGSSHKFYEVTVDGCQVAVRFGRIGDSGQLKNDTYPTPEKALAEATKKINEKLRKGYERATMGVRKKRSVTRRTALLDAAPPPAAGPQGRTRTRQAPAPPQPVTNRAPVLWKFDTGSPAFGIFIDGNFCWVGNEAGQIFALDHQGEIQSRFKLPDGVKCIVADDDWLYAGCDDGNVYDLSGKVPRVAYEIAEDVDIYWLDISDGILAVSDDRGNITVINHEDESQWTRKSRGSSGWMVRCDEIGVYHGHSWGVTMYDWDGGKLIWDQATVGGVLFGWQEESTVFAGTGAGRIHSFAKSGEPGPVYLCDGAVFSCATSEDAKFVFAGDTSSSIYCFAQNGDRLWKLATGCGSALSMQYFQDRLFIVTRHGVLACIDASEAAIQAAQSGTVPTVVTIQAPATVVEEVVPTAVETTADAGQGVVVECFREAGKLRVRVISEGFNPNWHCQFPKNLRQEDVRFVVDEVRKAARGEFYRVLGGIRKLETT